MIGVRIEAAKTSARSFSFLFTHHRSLAQEFVFFHGLTEVDVFACLLEEYEALSEKYTEGKEKNGVSREYKNTISLKKKF